MQSQSQSSQTKPAPSNRAKQESRRDSSRSTQDKLSLENALFRCETERLMSMWDKL